MNKKSAIFYSFILFSLFLISIMWVACKPADTDGTIQGDYDYEITRPTREAAGFAALEPVEDCEALIVTLKDKAIQEMEARIDSYINEATQCGGCCYYMYADEYGDDDDDGGAVPEAGDDDSGSSEDGASEYSETNTQEEGIDEADFIKNDGAYIYVVANNTFKIIDAWPPEEARVISKIEIEGTPTKLFVHNDHVLIYASTEYIDINQSYYDFSGYGGGECTYGYDCDFTGDNRKLHISVFDISDRTNPVLKREIRFSGSYINSRRIGSAVHTVVLAPGYTPPELQYWPDIMERCWDWQGGNDPTLEELVEAFEALKERNREIIDNSTAADWLPVIEDTLYPDNSTVVTANLLQDCSNIYEPGIEDRQSFLSVLSFDIDELDNASHSTILARPGAVYASGSALYIAARQIYSYGDQWYFDNSTQIPQATTVHKFNLYKEPAGTLYAASGIVKGRVLNQFSMDEYENYFRIATTTGHLPDENVHNTLVILRDNSGVLEAVGTVDNIAPTEDIRSVRFDDNRAFMVTFKKTDPLFTFDLSEPTSPQVEAELKIPGYSTYIHQMDENHLLTIGYDAEEAGDFAWFQGILLQMFNVSVMTDPQLMYREVLGSRGTSSEAATNHLAFNYFAPRDLLALPMTICESSEGGGDYADEISFSGLLVYRVTIERGFDELGGVEHVEPGTETDYYSCGSWWTQSSSIVKRSVFMDNYVYSVALDQIKIQNIYLLGVDVAVIDL